MGFQLRPTPTLPAMSGRCGGVGGWVSSVPVPQPDNAHLSQMPVVRWKTTVVRVWPALVQAVSIDPLERETVTTGTAPARCAS
jgi:hypothetical protein